MSECDKDELQMKLDANHEELKVILNNPEGIDENALSENVSELRSLCGVP